MRRRNLQILFNNTTLVPFKWRNKYMCFYCGGDFNSYDVLLKHTHSHGKCSEKDRAIKLVKSPDSEIKIDVSVIVCKICSVPFDSFGDIVNHLIIDHNLPFNKDVEMMITPYRLVDLKCLHCNDSFDYFTKLISHLNTNHPINSFFCAECEQSFNKKRDLDAHTRTRHKKEFSCTKCAENFPTNAELQRHRINAHYSSCNLCFKSFPSLNKRLIHMRREHTSDQTRCGFCHNTFTTKQALLRHAAKCDSVEKVVLIDDDDKKNSVKELRNNIASIVTLSTAMPFKFYMNKFRCFYCTKDFLKCNDLREHTNAEHPVCDVTFKSMKLRNRYDGVQIKIDTSSLSCKLCYEHLHDLVDLVEHFKSEHKTNLDSSVTTDIQSFKLVTDNFACPYCGEVYRYFGLLLKHVSVTHTDNKNICVYCGKSFRTDPNLRSHISQKHRDAGRYSCKVCDLLFPTNTAVNIHLGVAHGDKCFKCSVCAERFTSQYLVLRHMLTAHDTGYKCEHCGKLFVKNSCMVNHVRRLHLKEKNVECSVCFDRFFDAQRLKMHMVKHIGERNFHCDVCGKKFLWKRNLRGHMASHNRNNGQSNR